ncbi:MAG: NUDIX domain-containing protein [Muribaculaceae bacterium]|nr:NUDIX domain-containing protein [Muribaculaceae bacterium]
MKEYTICFLFTADLSSILFVRKARTEFKGMLNGVGGEIEENETPYECALREISEEAGLGPNMLLDLKYGRKLMPLGRLEPLHDCKYGSETNCVLHYFAGIVDHRAMTAICPSEEPVEWRASSEAASSGTDTEIFAGNGDVAYFTAAAMKLLRPYAQAAPQKPEAGSLEQMLDLHKRYLDSAARREDWLGVSDEASQIARLAYAICWRNHNAHKTEA